MLQITQEGNEVLINYESLENELKSLLSGAGKIEVTKHWLQGVEVQIELDKPVVVNAGGGQEINHFTKYWRPDVVFLELPRNGERVISLRLKMELSLPVLPEEPAAEYIRCRLRKMASLIAQGRWEY